MNTAETAITTAPAKPSPGTIAPGETVLLLGNYRPALVIARVLTSLGCQVIIGRGGGEGCVEYSHHISACWDHPPLTDRSGEFIDALNTFLTRRPDISVVYPVAEEFVACLALHRRRVSDRVIIACADNVSICRARDKLAMLDLADKTGVPNLPYQRVLGRQHLLPAAEEVGFPLVIRPLDPCVRFGHKKALICRSRADLTWLSENWPRSDKGVLLQKFATGERHNVFFAAANGRILRALHTRILRTDHPDGTGLAVDGVTIKPRGDLDGDTGKLVRALNYTGVGLAQYIIDPDTGQRCFLELNARIAGSHAICEAMGFELSRMAIELARSNTPPEHALSDFKYEPGRRYAWTYGDIRGLKSAVIKGETGLGGSFAWLSNLVITALLADFHMTWQWRDPLPACMLLLRQFPGFSATNPKFKRLLQLSTEAK